jgi:hypothetical protein
MTAKRHISYPSIEQFRNVVSNLNRQFTFVGLDADNNAIYDPTIPKPTLTFKGTVKLHGTNSSVSYNAIDGIWVQSRENIITPQSDNAGFAFFVETKKDIFTRMFNEVIEKEAVDISLNTVVIYGEWAGKGIQSGVGISQLPKAFYIFGVKVSPNDNPTESDHVVDGKRSVAYWVDSEYLKDTDNQIFNINDFKTFSIDIDFNYPELAQNLMIAITDEVEQECPVSKHLGVSGIGEGVVWSVRYKGVVHRFKVKGEKHSAKSKVKTLKPVDDEKVNKIINLVNQVTPEWRLDQMLEKACDFMNGGTLDRSKLGDYIRYVIADIVKEETLTLSEAGVEPKEINKYVSEVARKYFFAREQNNL